MVVVIDVPFATSTIVHVLAAGAAAVYPARDDEIARRAAGERPDAVLAGEYLAITQPGQAPGHAAGAGLAFAHRWRSDLHHHQRHPRDRRLRRRGRGGAQR